MIATYMKHLCSCRSSSQILKLRAAQSLRKVVLALLLLAPGGGGISTPCCSIGVARQSNYHGHQKFWSFTRHLAVSNGAHGALPAPQQLTVGFCSASVCYPCSSWICGFMVPHPYTLVRRQQLSLQAGPIQILKQIWHAGRHWGCTGLHVKLRQCHTDREGF
jgi:hypothetical protein